MIVVLIDALRPKGFPGGTSGKEPARQCRRYKKNVFTPWVGKSLWGWARQPTPGQRSLVGYTPWGRKELDTAKATEHAHTHRT